MRTNKLWTQVAAIRLCERLEPIAARHGGHIALTGSTLYGDAAKGMAPEDGNAIAVARRDVDIMIYRSADEPEFNWQAFFAEIKEELGIEACVDYGYCKKARTATGALIDFFDPFRGGEKVSDSDE